MEAPKNPHPFQKRVAELMLTEKRNVILQAPTGSGKTHAALLPFLNALEYERDFPTKCIYSVPMRALANQFVESYQEKVKHAGRDDRIKVKIQTGDQPEDREFVSNLIFATIDQTLSSFLIAPYSLPRRLANLNAAAVMGSYLVFDEFHLYEPGSTLPTTLHMLQLLKGITPFILMTATFSADMLEALAKLLDAEVVPQNEQERQQLQTLDSQQKTRRYHVPSQPLSAEAVLDRHEKRSLVICNTVDRARALYESLLKSNPADTEILLLHSRFLKEDRDKTENRIRQAFGKGVSDGSLIVVSTQAIEVGVDITSTALHTELAPANAVIQRAGRCARYKGDTGDVYLYQYTADETNDEIIDLCENIMPYSSQAEQFASTLQQFRDRSGSALDFSDEQAIITAVHGARDRQIVAELSATGFEHRRRMFAVMRGDQNEDARNLIREVFQQRVTIHPNPDELLESPFSVPAFGVHPGTLQGYVQRWLERYQSDDSIPWVVKWLKQEEDPDQSNRSVYRWIDVRDHAREVFGAPLVVVHPALATYKPELGFLPDRGGVWFAQPADDSQQVERPLPTYRLETYEDHIRRVYQAFTEMWSEMAQAARRLEQQYSWQPGSIRHAVEIAILLHDVGKLSAQWQAWVQKYQQAIGEPVEKGRAYAHTELRSDAQREAEKRMGKRPWHAVEGALAVTPILNTAFRENPLLATAIYSAIARHHAPFSYSNGAYRLSKDAQQHTLAALPREWHDQLLVDLVTQGQKDEDINRNFVIILNDDPHEDDIAIYFAYLLIVRLLRLADQLGTSRGAKGVD